MWQKCNSVRASGILNEKYLARGVSQRWPACSANVCQKHALTLADVALTIQNLFPQNKDA